MSNYTTWRFSGSIWGFVFVAAEWSHQLVQEEHESDDKGNVNLLSIGLQGLNHAQNSFDQSARSAISAAGSLSSSNGGDTVDLSSSAVSMLSAKNEFSTDLAYLKTADKMEREAINMVA